MTVSADSTPIRVRLEEPALDETDELAVLGVLRRRWLMMGPETEALEAEFAGRLGVRHAVAVSSGSAAMHLAMLVLGIGPRDEVVQPAIEFVATANATTAVGAEPAFADIESVDRPLVGPEQLDRAWSCRVTAVVVSHYGGYACDLPAIREYCRTHDLFLIEDAGAALGGFCEGRPLGTWGDVGCFSLSAGQMITAGQGGVLVTNDDDVARRARLMRGHGLVDTQGDPSHDGQGEYDAAVNGFNLRIDELRAALARAQLARLDELLRRRRAHTATYRSLLASAPGISVVGYGGADVETSACHLMAVVAESSTRDALRARCRERGVQTGVHYPCVAELSAFRGATSPRQVRMSLEYARRVITLPLHPSLRRSDLEIVCGALGSREEVGVS